ncbi:TetR/AcrR family transcriptional regulator [Breoghania sp.]|uniref:TetR/AcrR family transcriptional regulator n=1 Tax=Breoghania sp. TaxID=2065378 RepID=UPI0029CA58AD|nr:TetR/AcrR family transcriptional regulator [Breoghania sp.]
MGRRPGSTARPTKSAILDAAERAIVQTGYKSLNFRDIAAEVGIKSSSVHYHYPTKGDLGAAVMRRYREDFSERLSHPPDDPEGAQAALNQFLDGFRANVVDLDSMSLCVVLLAEKNLLDEATTEELSAFYQLKLAWLSEVVSIISRGAKSKEACEREACSILAALHGASVLVKATGDGSFYEKAVREYRNLANRMALA